MNQVQTVPLQSQGGTRLSLAGQRRHADAFLGGLLLAHLLLALALAPVRGTWVPALVIGGLTSVGAFLATRYLRGTLTSRMVVGVAFMIYSGLIIHQSGGMVEMHFHVFGGLAFMLMYRDWRVPVVAAVVIILHHIHVHALQANGFPVYVLPAGEHHAFPRILVHAAFVAFETSVLVYIAVLMRREAEQADALVAIARKLASGDADIDAQGDDVVGSFGGVAQQLRRIGDEADRLRLHVAEGTYAARVDTTGFPGLYGGLASNLNQLVGAIETSNERVRAEQDAAVLFLNAMDDAISAVARRDLTARVEGSFGERYDAMRDAVNSAVQNLDDAMSEVATASEEVAHAADQISDSSQELARGSSGQAASLHEVSGVLNELASAAAHTARNASEAQATAEHAGTTSRGGVDVMRRLTEAMHDLKQSSDSTAKIVKTIDEIAFQTNLLALNASVEAARAGDAGRGFAVVAEEVRALALRSASAAEQTSHLIDESARKTDHGVALNGEALARLEEITKGTERTISVMESIAAASRQQTGAVEQIRKTALELNGATDATAANAEESASAAHELSAQAERMRDLAASFRLTGTRRAEEAPAGHVNGKRGGAVHRELAHVQATR